MHNTYVFIAGPYAAKGGGHDAAYWYEIDAHINEARLWATKLADEGIPFFCPHMNSAHMEVLSPSSTVNYWYNLDLLILEHASAIFLIPGWEDSKGALAEKRRAIELCIPIYSYDEYRRGNLSGFSFSALVKHWHEDSERKDNE